MQVLHHLKKDKGSYISFGIIIFFTALMLNLALVLTFQVDQAYDAKFESLHTAAINICIPKMQNTEQLAEEIKALEGVEEAECREAVFAETIVKDFRDTDFSMNTVFYNMDEERTLNQLEIREESRGGSEQSIYLPLYVASFGEFAPGDEITYEKDGGSYTFHVSGVVEEMQYGNYGKGLMGAYLPGSVYEDFASTHAENTVMEYSLLTEEDAELKEVQNELSDLLSRQGITMLVSNDSVSTKETRTMVCSLLILILSAFALVILLVSVFLCKFRISNSIEEEMINMGVLKAVGYTGSMIAASMVLPYVMVTVLAALVGVGVSYGILPALSQVLTLQSGFSFALSFDGKSLICVQVLLVCIVTAFTYGAARRIKKIQPIHAIRGIGGGKSIRKNYFPLESTKGNTQILLMCKQMFACRKQNILLFLVSFVLTVLVAFSGTLFYNVIIEPDNFMSTLSEETPDLIVYPEKEHQEALMDALQVDSQVQTVLQYTVGNVTIGDTAVTAFVCEGFDQVSNDLCYLGENPQAEDEIALGSAFAEKYELGDTIEITVGEMSRTYRVTGFVQSVNYQGNVCEFTVEGYQALCTEEVVPALYVYLGEDADTEGFMEVLEAQQGDQIVKTVNAQQMAKTSQEMYAGIAAVLISVIFVLTMLIVLFVLYIVIKSLLVQRKQELGIYKAMGYSNWQLMMQMAGSFLPVSVAAVLLSSVLGLVYMPDINQLIFRTVGAMKNHMEVSFLFLMIFALVQIVMNFVISICLTLPVKKISAYALIKE